MNKSIGFLGLLVAAVVSCAMVCSCSGDDGEGRDAGVDAALSIGKTTYSFGSAYWQCYADTIEKPAGGKYRCQLEFFSFDYYQAAARGKMPREYSFVVVSFSSDVRLDELSSVVVKAGDWQLSGALGMPRGKGESDYYLQEAANHPNGDLVVEKRGGEYRVSINPVFMDYERPGDHSWFVIESPFVFAGAIDKVPRKYALYAE